jgi:putative ABC transport system ATP-binding protein
MNVLELIGVCMTRGAGRRAVRVLVDVSLAADPGEFVLVQGPSGSGKTTLLAVAAGLLTPDSGEVLLSGRSLPRVGATQRRRLRARQVGFVFQRSNLLGALSARDNVLTAAALAGMERPEAEREADRLLELLGVAALALRRPAELSGGEEQRVAVARALVHRPAIVFADEPTASLDGASGRTVAESLRGLARQQGTAVIVATHDARLEEFATRRIHLVDGRIEGA